MSRGGYHGVVPIMGRVTINGTTAQFSCKRSIPMELWDTKGNCAKGKSKEAREINFALDDIKAQIIKAHYKRKDISMLVIDFSRFARRRTCARLHQGVQHLPYDGTQSETGNGMDGLYATEGCHYPRPQQRADTPKSICPNGMKEQQKEKDGRTDKKPVTRLSLS